MAIGIGEILSLTHGSLGILIIVGLPWVMAEILALHDKAGLKRLKLVILAVTISAFLSAIIFAAPTYITYYPDAKAVINAGETPWVHGILMEVKEHIGLLAPMIAFAAAGLIWTSSDRLIDDKNQKRLVFVLVIIAFIIAFSVMSMGAYITKTAPIGA